MAGQVEAVGKNVTRFQPGGEVFGDLTIYGYGISAEYACAPEDAFVLLPANLRFDEAATVPPAATMAPQGLRANHGFLQTTGRTKGQVQPGHKVLINGAGGNVRPSAVQIAKSFGAEVTGVDHTNKLGMLLSIGAGHVIDYAEEDNTKTGQQYDRIFDLTAFRSIFERKSVASQRRLCHGPGFHIWNVPSNVHGATGLDDQRPEDGAVPRLDLFGAGMPPVDEQFATGS